MAPGFALTAVVRKEQCLARGHTGGREGGSVRRMVIVALGTALLCGAGVSALAEEQIPAAAADAGKSEMETLQQQIRELEKTLQAATKKLADDAEVSDAKKKMEEARKAFEELVARKLEADPATAESVKKMKELRAKMEEMKKAGKKQGDAGEKEKKEKKERKEKEEKKAEAAAPAPEASK
jgi:hypothetical protein